MNNDSIRVRVSIDIPRETAAQHWPSARNERELADAFRKYMKEHAGMLARDLVEDRRQ